MKILYISQFYNPERVAAAFRAFDNSRLWVKEGNIVTVLTGYPNFPTGKIFEGYVPRILREEIIEGVRVLRSKIIIKENTSKIKRGISSLSFMFFGIWNIIFNGKKIGKDYDAIIGTSGTIFAPIIAYIYSVLYKTPFILEIRDITYRQILAVYNGEERFLYKLVKWLEIFLCKKANRVIVVTNGFKKELIKSGIDDKKIDVIPNGIDVKNIKISDDNSKSDEVIFSYMGNIGASQNLIEIINIFNLIELNNYSKRLILIGDGAEKEEIKKYVSSNRINNVIIKDGMSSNDLEKYYDISDLCIVSLKNNKFFNETIPSKIFQIMGRGKNVIFFGPKGEASNIVDKVNKSFVFTEKDICKIVNKLNNILNDINLKKKIKNYSYNCRKLVETNFDREVLALKYRDIIYEVVKDYKIKNTRI